MIPIAHIAVEPKAYDIVDPSKAKVDDNFIKKLGKHLKKLVSYYQNAPGRDKVKETAEAPPKEQDEELEKGKLYDQTQDRETTQKQSKEQKVKSEEPEENSEQEEWPKTTLKEQDEKSEKSNKEDQPGNQKPYDESLDKVSETKEKPPKEQDEQSEELEENKFDHQTLDNEKLPQTPPKEPDEKSEEPKEEDQPDIPNQYDDSFDKVPETTEEPSKEQDEESEETVEDKVNSEEPEQKPLQEELPETTTKVQGEEPEKPKGEDQPGIPSPDDESFEYEDTAEDMKKAEQNKKSEIKPIDPDSEESEEVKSEKPKKKKKKANFRSSGPKKPRPPAKELVPAAIQEMLNNNKTLMDQWKEKYTEMLQQEPIKSADPFAPPQDNCTEKNIALYLPYPYGSTYNVGGSHSDTGGSGVHSSVDIWGGIAAGVPVPCIWGPKCSAMITAAHGGEVKVWSNCNVRITHVCSRISTQYYHMEQMEASGLDGKMIAPGQNLGYYARNKEEALCESGRTNGAHMHWTLRRNGKPVSLEGQVVSGYTITVGTINYCDCVQENNGKCKTGYLIKGPNKICPNHGVINDAKP